MAKLNTTILKMPNIIGTVSWIRTLSTGPVINLAFFINLFFYCSHKAYNTYMQINMHCYTILNIYSLLLIIYAAICNFEQAQLNRPLKLKKILMIFA